MALLKFQTSPNNSNHRFIKAVASPIRLPLQLFFQFRREADCCLLPFTLFFFHISPFPLLLSLLVCCLSLTHSHKSCKTSYNSFYSYTSIKLDLSGTKIKSMGIPDNSLIFRNCDSEGSVFPFSQLTTVVGETPSIFAHSFCFIFAFTLTASNEILGICTTPFLISKSILIEFLSFVKHKFNFFEFNIEFV